MNCNTPCSSCNQYLDAKCITVRNSYPCLDISKNDNLEEAISAISNVICEFDPPNPVSYNVQGVEGNIEVTPSTIGNTTTFTVGLDKDITDLLVEITDDISIINSELANKICDITTNTPQYLQITNPSGCEYNIDFLPSGFVTYDGIIENNYSQPKTSGSIGTELLIDYNNNFISSNQLSVGDIITVTSTAELEVCNNPSQQYILRFASNSSTKHDIIFDSNYYPTSDIYKTIVIEMVMRVNVKSNTEAYVSSYIDFSSPAGVGGLNVELGDRAQMSIRVYPVKTKTVTGINWSNVSFQVISDDKCGVVNKVGEFFVDVRKKL